MVSQSVAGLIARVYSQTHTRGTRQLLLVNWPAYMSTAISYTALYTIIHEDATPRGAKTIRMTVPKQPVDAVYGSFYNWTRRAAAHQDADRQTC